MLPKSNASRNKTLVLCVFCPGLPDEPQRRLAGLVLDDGSLVLDLFIACSATPTVAHRGHGVLRIRVLRHPLLATECVRYLA